MKSAMPQLLQERTTPTLFLDFDGTLHVGHPVADVDGQVSLESGRQLFEYAPLLVELLAPYPDVEIVLTTSWLDAMNDETVLAYLPPELSRRVIDTTRGRRARLSYMLNGSGRTDVITCYAFGKGLTQWLAIDDSVYGAYHFGREPGQLMRNFLLLDSSRGISDEGRSAANSRVARRGAQGCQHVVFRTKLTRHAESFGHGYADVQFPQPIPSPRYTFDAQSNCRNIA